MPDDLEILRQHIALKKLKAHIASKKVVSPGLDQANVGYGAQLSGTMEKTRNNPDPVVGTALRAAGETLYNTGRVVAQSPFNPPALNAVTALAPEKTEYTQKAEAARESQTVGQNAVSDLIQLAPYLMVRGAPFVATAGEQVVKDPKVLWEMLKDVGRSAVDVARVGQPLPPPELVDKVSKRLIPTLTNVMLPLGMAGHVAGKFGKKGKIAEKEILRGLQEQKGQEAEGQKAQAVPEIAQAEGEVTAQGTEAVGKQPWEMTRDELESKYTKAGSVVDGRRVRSEIPNMASIESSVENSTVLPGIYEIPLSEFEGGLTGKHYSVSGNKRIAELADEISINKEINPLIVVIDKDGPYILEGSTRAEALYKSGAKSFPAKIVLDEGSFYDAAKRAVDEGRPVPPEVLADYPDLAAKYPIPGTVVPEKGTSVPKSESVGTGKGVEPPKPPSGKTFTKITPTEELGAGFNITKPFGSKQQQLARALRTAEGRRADVAPTVELQERPANAGTVVQHPLHKYDAIPDEFGEISPKKYGLPAAKASQLLSLNELDVRRMQGKGQRELKNIVREVSGREWKQYNDQIVDAIESPIEELPKRSLPERVKSVVRKIKERFDRERKEIIGIKRDELRQSFGKIAEQGYRQDNGLKGKRLTPEQKAEIATRTDELLKAEIPDDWGIKDYFRHLHQGDFAILRDGQYIGSAESWSKALPKIAENYAANPGEGAPNYKILLREFHDPDVVRVSRGRQYKIINDLAKAFEEGSTEDIRQILRGKIGAKEAKRKWAGFMQERKGAPGYEKDVRFVLNYHNRMYNRWKGLYKLQADIQPLIKQIRAEGRDMVAQEIEANLAELWGRPQKYKGEWEVRKWAGRIGGLDMALRLKINLRYNLLNNLQLLQTGVGTVFGWKDFAWAQKAVRTDAGKALLDKYGVYDIVQGTGGELGRNFTSPEWRSSKAARWTRVFTSETSNQAEAWLSVYKHGKDLGMADQAAADYAFLRGMVYSQFLPLKTNKPRALRSAVLANTIGKYRNFTIHAVELAADLGKKTFGKDVQISDRMANAARLGHFFTAQLVLGGTRLVTGPLAKLGIGGYFTYKMYKKIEDEYGKGTADLIYFGAPSLINSDWSASVQLIDLPYAESIPEAIGQVVLGPMGGSMLNVAKAGRVATGYEAADWKQWSRAFIEAFGGTKQLEGIEKVITKDYDFRSPSGKLQFKGELKDALTQMYGSRPVAAAVQSMQIDAYTELFAERNDAINEAVRGNKEAITKFNAKWPEVAIKQDEVTNRSESRKEDENKSTAERMITSKWGKKEFGLPDEPTGKKQKKQKKQKERKRQP
jgi:hypothetical protein